MQAGCSKKCLAGRAERRGDVTASRVDTGAKGERFAGQLRTVLAAQFLQRRQRLRKTLLPQERPRETERCAAGHLVTADCCSRRVRGSKRCLRLREESLVRPHNAR